MRAKWPLLALLCTAQFVDVLDVNAVIVALPVIGRDLGLSGGSLQWVVTAYVLVFAGCLLVAGRLVDKYGRRRMFRIGLGTFTVASLACGLAPGALLLILARAVQGLGAALTAPAALAMIVAAFPDGAPRKQAIATWTAVAAVGGAAGLVLGGLIAGGPGWRWIFLINVPVGVLAFVLTFWLVAESHGEQRPLDLAGAGAITSALACFVFAMSQAEHALGLGALAGVVAAALLLAWFVRRERRSKHPLLPPDLIRTRAVVAAAAAAAVLTATTSGGGVLATLELQDSLGLTPATTGLMLLPLSISVVVGSVMAPRIEWPTRRLVGGGLALIGVGSAIAAASPSLPGVLGWALLAGVGLGSASVAATNLGTSAVEDSQRGTVAGLLNTAATTGTAVGVAALVVAASTADGTNGYRIGMVVAAATAMIAAVAMARLARPRPVGGTRG